MTFPILCGRAQPGGTYQVRLHERWGYMRAFAGRAASCCLATLWLCEAHACAACCMQAPVLALLADFGSGDDVATASLSMSELRVLLHELGHAVHSLLSRTTYQHLSGTRCVLDTGCC